MNRYLKYSLIGTGAAFGVAVAGVGYLALTFDPNDYKEQIVKAVKESKQRDLRIDGNIALSFYPDIGANIGKVSLSEHNSAQPFAAVGSARVSLALMPLFSGRAVVNEITIDGLQATLIRHKDGTTNIDDLLSKDEDEKNQPVEFDIAAISVTHTTLGYLDEGSGAQYTAKNLNLHTGRVAVGVPVNVDLAARVEASQPKLGLDTQLKATLTFDPDKQQFRVQGLDLQAGGSALDIADLNVQAQGDLAADLAAQAFGAQDFSLKASGKQGGNAFEAALEAPRIEADKRGFNGEKLALTARLKGVNDIAATLNLPSLQGNARAFGSKDLTLTMDAKGDALPGKQVRSEMKGSFAFDADKQHIEVDLAGGLLQSKVKARVAADGFDKPAIGFDVDVDQFDADLYLPKSSAGTAKAAEPEQPFDLSALQGLNLTGSLRVGALTVANVKASKVRLDIKARDGMLNVSPLSANLYQGSMSGSLGIQAKAVPVFTVRQTLSGIDIAALTKDAADFDTLEGRGNIGVNLAARGNTVGALKKSLDGALTLNLADGAIKGINIAKSLREFGRSTTARTQEANAAEKTDFSELKASFKVADGVAHNDDLMLKSPLLRLTGNGDIDIGNDRMNYLAKSTLAKTLEGQGGKETVGGITVPVRISGPFDGLKYTLDFGAMLSESAKQKVETKKEEVKTRLQDKLKGLLR